MSSLSLLAGRTVHYSIMLANICSRRLEQKTVSDVIFVGALRVEMIEVYEKHNYSPLRSEGKGL